MTCVVGMVDNGTITFGSDSAGGYGHEIYTIDLPKVFARDEFLFGYCGSYRIGQILRYWVELPDMPESMEPERFLVRELVPAIREAVSEEGAAGPGRAFLGETTCILVGLRGEIWCVGADLTVTPESVYAAIGSGRLTAYGVLRALTVSGVEPVRRRLELALESAAEFTANVRPPWHFVTMAGRAGPGAC